MIVASSSSNSSFSNSSPGGLFANSTRQNSVSQSSGVSSRKRGSLTDSR